uniref:Uncharacterized protein n=1 Tax=viral metagenome TaxID=1070528 RepID=A0A6M3IE14_9ZZZZ
MKIYDKENFEWKCKNAKRPKFSMHRGRTWDFMKGKIDNVDVKFHIDTTWSHYCYFEWKGKWYKVENTIFPDISIFTTIAKSKTQGVLTDTRLIC